MKTPILRTFRSFVPAFVLRALRFAPYHRGQGSSATCDTQQRAGAASVVTSRYPRVIAHLRNGYLVAVSRLSGALPQGLPHDSSCRLPRDPWKYEGRDLTDKQRREALQLAASREFDLFVSLRGS